MPTFWPCRVAEATERAEMLRELLVETPLGHILATGLHEYLDLVQIHLQELAGAVGRAFFRDWRPEPAPEIQMQVQIQVSA